MISPYQNNPQEFLNKFSMILATSENGAIGKDNKLLWHLPNDLKRFKKLTTNKIVVMGRNTYESLPNGALPGRLNIIMCNDDKDFLKRTETIEKTNTGIAKLSNIQEVFNFIHNYELDPLMDNIEVDEIFIIGGAKIYELFLGYINKLYMTFVDVDIDGDAFIPDINRFDWEELEEIVNYKDDKHEYDYTFLTLKKIRKK